MQLSQLYRRGVVRPLDDSAADQLACFCITTPIRAEWLPVLGDDQFSAIWQAGVLQCINSACGSRISDYEEVELQVDQLSPALEAIRESALSSDQTIAIFFQGLERLLIDAVEADRRVYFVF